MEILKAFLAKLFITAVITILIFVYYIISCVPYIGTTLQFVFKTPFIMIATITPLVSSILLRIIYNRFDFPITFLRDGHIFIIGLNVFVLIFSWYESGFSFWYIATVLLSLYFYKANQLLYYQAEYFAAGGYISPTDNAESFYKRIYNARRQAEIKTYFVTQRYKEALKNHKALNTEETKQALKESEAEMENLLGIKKTSKATTERKPKQPEYKTLREAYDALTDEEKENAKKMMQSYADIMKH